MNKKVIIAIVVVLLVLVIIAALMWPSSDTVDVPASTPTPEPKPTEQTAPAVVDTTPLSWVKKVRIELPIKHALGMTSSYIDLAELEIYDVMNRNVARGLAVKSSSSYDADLYPNSNLVDGNVKTFMHTGTSKVGNVEWVEVVLPDPRSDSELVKLIKVFSRSGFPERIVGGRLQIYDNTGKIIKEWTFDKGQPSYSFTV